MAARLPISASLAARAGRESWGRCIPPAYRRQRGSPDAGHRLPPMSGPRDSVVGCLKNPCPPARSPVRNPAVTSQLETGPS